MGLTIGAGDLLLNLDRNQQEFKNTVTQLSSGLRVNSAADDPSGNAIATTLQSKVGGLQQAAQNVQNANNALNVANGALVTVQRLLERVNTLIVQANSDINSSADLQDIQAEINQLLTEINAIGEKTSFNGLNLLNGAFDNSPGAAYQFTQVTSPNGGSTAVANYNGLGQAGPLVTNAGVPPGGYFEPALMVFTVTGYSANAIDPDTGTNVGPGVYVQFSAYSTGSNFGAAPLYQDTTAISVNSGQIVNAQYVTPSGSSIIIQFTLSNLTQADVGSSIAFESIAPVGASTGSPLTVNDGGNEGTTVGITLPTINTNALNISNVSVLPPQTVNYLNAPQGASSSNSVVASYSEILVQNALTSVTTAEATIGAQQVALNIDNGNDNTAIVNYQSSASDITDLNIGAATTKYTQEQILVNVGTSVLSQMESVDKINTALLIQALVA